MLNFKNYLIEVAKNNIGKDSSLTPITNSDKFVPSRPEFREFKKEKRKSVSGLDIYTKHEKDHAVIGEAQHLWVHPEDNRIAFQLHATTFHHPGTDDVTYKHIMSKSHGTVKGGIGHHAYYDLMKGLILFVLVIMLLNNFFTGAMKMATKLKKAYPHVVEHGYDEYAKKAYNSPRYIKSDSLHNNDGSKQYKLAANIAGIHAVRFVPKKHRYKNINEELISEINLNTISKSYSADMPDTASGYGIRNSRHSFVSSTGYNVHTKIIKDSMHSKMNTKLNIYGNIQKQKRFIYMLLLM